MDHADKWTNATVSNIREQTLRNIKGKIQHGFMISNPE
jgi:hypothetical protein